VREQLKVAARAFVWTFLGALLYVGVFAVFAAVAAFVVKLAQPGEVARSVILFAGAAVGIVAGLAVNFAIAPLHLRKMLPTSRLADEEVLARIHACFERASLPRPPVWVMELERFRVANLIVTGFRSRLSPIRQSLFISRTALNELTPGELEAAILHEVAHASLRHLRKRFSLAAALVLCMLCGATFVVLLTQLLLPGLGALMGPLAGAFAFFTTFRVLGSQSRFQELEADIHSIRDLAGSLPALAAALRKLDRINSAAHPASSDALSLRTHPDTEARIRALEAYFERFPVPTRDPARRENEAA
jgi:Zn-dependent protease with chaperone function